MSIFFQFLKFKYYIFKQKCIPNTEINQKQLEYLNCDTPGLTQYTCLSIQNQLCTFNKGYCQILAEQDFSNYQCDMQLNKAACINIKTKGQFCLWNGQNCQNVEINQESDCAMFDKFQVNGNVCQAITTPNAKCKYDEIRKICIQSSPNDYCTTPYLNLHGCVSRLKLENQICQWLDLSCQDIIIIPFETSCSSLRYANYQACQLVFENYELGCYFDNKKQQCVTLIINSDIVYLEQSSGDQLQRKQQYFTRNTIANQFLSTVSCFDTSLGLNRIICGSITTENILCRFHQNSCKIVEKEAIANLACTDLRFANPSTCALVKYNDEYCRYFKKEKGCINQLKGEMNCNDLGLNQESCKQAKGNCYRQNSLLFIYFDNNKCQSLGDISYQISEADLIVLQKLECLSNTPTKLVCLEIQTKGQLCQWSNKYQQCREIWVDQNKKCADFSSFKVNVNVCASILMNNPNNIILGIGQSFDEQNHGFCEYDRQGKTCKVKSTACINTNQLCNQYRLQIQFVCTSKCCTQNEEIGINAHSCSRYSNQDPGVYCYFKDFRCQELTYLDVDISNPNIVKIYYNVNKFTCAQMNKNSCHMIEWSTSQICYYNGFACLNLNLKSQVDLIEFIKPSAILNIYACLAIEAVNSVNLSQKYIEYDQVAKHCKFLQQPYPKYQSCESVF